MRNTRVRTHTLVFPLVKSILFKVYLHPNGVIINLTRLELTLGDELPDRVFCVSAFDEHKPEGPFR